MTPDTRADRPPGLAARSLGVVAAVFSGLYLLSDVIEAAQGGFSGLQLTLTLVAEAAIPPFVVGLYLVQRPQIGRLGLISAVAYAYSYVFFTGTVIYALVNDTRDYAALTGKLGASMTIHGAIMVFAGIGFGMAVMRARVLPRWTGVALAVGVVAVAATQAAPEGVQLVAAGIRAVAFGGMGFALTKWSGHPADRRHVSDNGDEIPGPIPSARAHGTQHPNRGGAGDSRSQSTRGAPRP
ncbi:hypothetical protein [Mycolicibacterium hodleri]|uniref:Integral membrane protein n=1 Tax=Mycolicibacterium hodleri TaxID=49897 RepID=A0A502E775_9MYCO|nr:hypothetical protein [Mycolicibacterium hodleri]TPG32702.1 hypothetical protein EAH80_17985 [Mycolicibacterium hodleri]